MTIRHPARARRAARPARGLLAGLRGSGRAHPLPRLADVHPGPPTGGRWIGLGTVPVECIRGTASMTVPRAQDFRPLAGREPADWPARWSRLASAAREQAILPPVQLLRAGGDYWVVDGHNRVALAHEQGQLWIDAEITELDVSSTNAADDAAKED
jgi:hypothetical protein